MYGKHGYTLKLPDGTTDRTDLYEKAISKVQYHWPDAVESKSDNILNGDSRTYFHSAKTGWCVACIREVYE